MKCCPQKLMGAKHQVQKYKGNKNHLNPKKILFLDDSNELVFSKSK